MKTIESTTVSVAAADQLSMAVLDLVAGIEDTDPVDLEPLYDAIDPDLLDSLPDADGFTELEFTYHGYAIAIADAADGLEVTLEDAELSLDPSTDGVADTESSI